MWTQNIKENKCPHNIEKMHQIVEKKKTLHCKVKIYLKSKKS